MKRLRFAAVALLCAIGFAVPAFAQLTTVTSTPPKVGGAPLSGTLTLTPVNSIGQPISVVSGGVLYPAQGFTANYTAGVLDANFQVPDQCTAVSLTPGTRVFYQVQIYNSATKLTTTIPSIGASGCTVTGATWALNSYAPVQAAVPAPTGFATGLTVPVNLSCAAPYEFYTQTNPPVTYKCVGGTLVQSTTQGNGQGVSLASAAPFNSGNTYPSNVVVTSAGSTFVSPLAGIAAGGSAPTAAAPGAWITLAAAGVNGTSGAGYGGTSASTNSLATGPATFTTQAGLAYVVGSRVRAAASAMLTSYLEGLVSAYNSLTGALSLAVDTVSGTGSVSAWNLSIAGTPGANGAGNSGASIPVNTFATLPQPSPAAPYTSYQTDAVAGQVGAVGGGTLTKLVRSLGTGQGYGPADSLEKNLPNGTHGLDASGHATLAQSSAALVSSTSVDLTAAPYYASPNGGTETTSTAAIASGATAIPVGTCSTFSANQYVNITAPGAGGTGSIVQVASCTGTTMTVAALPAAYASGARIRHDESVPMQQAVTALRLTGGTIYLPDGASGPGQYNLNGPLQDTSLSNAMFVMSKDNLGSLSSYGITTIQGTGAPLGFAGSVTVLKTDLATGNLFGGRNAASSSPQNYGGLVMAHVRFDKVRFVDTSTNPGAVMVNGQYFSNLNIGDIWCVSAGTGIPTATTGGCVKLGHIGNDVDNYAHMITTVGFYNGVTAGEHTQIDRLYGANTGCLLTPDSIAAENTVWGGGSPISTNGAESVGVGNMWGQQITHMLCGGGSPQTVKVARLDAEQSQGTIVEDPSAYLTGMIDYLVAYNDSRSVNTHTVAKCNIGPNLKMTDMSQPFLVNACQSGTSATAGATQIAHFSMQDGSGATTSANTIAPSKPLTNTAITYATTNGVANVAQFVAANGSKAQYADNTYLAFDGTSSFSGCMNTLPTSFAAGDQVAMGNIDLSGTNPNGWSFEHGYDANSVTFNLFNGTSNTSLSTRIAFGTSISSAVHRICFTYDASKALASRVTILVDNAAVTTSNNSSSLSGAVTATKPFTVGRNGSNQQPFAGGIYNVDFWTGVANAAQMQ